MWFECVCVLGREVSFKGVQIFCLQAVLTEVLLASEDYINLEVNNFGNLWSNEKCFQLSFKYISCTFWTTKLRIEVKKNH